MRYGEQFDQHLTLSPQALREAFLAFAVTHHSDGVKRRAQPGPADSTEFTWETDQFLISATALYRKGESTIWTELPRIELERFHQLWNEFLDYLILTRVSKVKLRLKGTPLKIAHAFLRFRTERDLHGWSIDARVTDDGGGQKIIFVSYSEVKDLFTRPEIPQFELSVYEDLEGSVINGTMPTHFFEPWLSLWVELQAFLAGEGFIEPNVAIPIGRRERGGKKARQRGPSPETLDNCEKAMGYWLDDSLDLKVACDRTGTSIAPATVRKWIETSLDRQPAKKRSKWIKKLNALKEDRHLGKYKKT